MKYQFKKFKPISVVEDFYILSQDDMPIMLFYDNEVNYNIELYDAKYIPKSGLLLCKYIEGICNGKEVLDIGTGYTSILAKHAIAFGAKHIDAIDLDEDVIKYVQNKVDSDKISAFVSDNLKNLNKRKYDLIVSNPSQMPLTETLNSIHDIAGKTGRENIEQIIEEAPNHLRKNGRLLMLIFGFLGINTTTQPNQKCIVDLLSRRMEIELVDHYLLKARENGAVFRNADFIEQIYPYYRFIRKNGELFNEIYIIQCIKKE